MGYLDIKLPFEEFKLSAEKVSLDKIYSALYCILSEEEYNKKMFDLLVSLLPETGLNGILCDALKKENKEAVEKILERYQFSSKTNLRLLDVCPVTMVHYILDHPEFQALSSSHIFYIRNPDIFEAYLKKYEPNFKEVAILMEDNPYNMYESHLAVWFRLFGLKGFSKKTLYYLLKNTNSTLRQTLAELDPSLQPYLNKILHQEEMSRQHNPMNRLFDSN